MTITALAIPICVSAQRSDTVVIRADSPLHPGVATLVEDLTLGGGSDLEEYQFSWPLVFAGRRGTVFVSDLVRAVGPGGVRSIVRLYDSTGRFVRSIGRAGQGPGEYAGAVNDVKELADGRILLSTSQAIFVYSAAGEPLGRWPARARRGALSVRGALILIDPAGFVYTYGDRRPPGPPAPGVEPVPFLYRFRLDGSLVDTLPAPESSVLDTRIRLGLTTMPFSRPHIAAWSPLGYFVTAFSGEYAVDLRLPRGPAPGAERSGAVWHPGDPVTSIRRSPPAVPVQAAESSDWRRSITMYNRSTRVPSNWEWTAPDVPRVKPPIRDLHVDAIGRIWVRLSQPARLNPAVTLPARQADASIVDAMYRWVEPYVFDVFEPSGRYLGVVALPEEISQDRYAPSQFSVHGDIVWATVEGAGGAPVVKRYRIRWAGQAR